MQAVPFKPLTEREYHAKGYAGGPDTLEQVNERLKEEHSKKVVAAQSIIMRYTSLLAPLMGDRDAVSRVREELRADEEFWESAPFVVKMVEDTHTWINGIFRSEAKRAERDYADKMAEIRAEREAKRQAERAAEKAEMESLSNFGMF